MSTLKALKAQFIILGSHAHLKLTKDARQIIVDNQIISPFPSVKSLGVIISEDRTWNEHINLVLSKIHYNLLFLRNKCYFLPLLTKINLVNSTIIPLLNYCCSVFSSASLYLLNKLTIALNEAQ